MAVFILTRGRIQTKVLARDIKEILGGIEGVKVRVVGDRVVLEGEVLRDQDWERVRKVVETFGQVMNFVQKNSLSMDKMVQLDVKMMEVQSPYAKVRYFGLTPPNFVFKVAGWTGVR